MAEATIHFPKGFLWGTATAAHQVEGNNTNNTWWAWEQEPGRILNGDKSGLACDWWNGRWREDFDRAAAGGQNAHRMSVEWSRIQPAPDRWDEDALDRYLDMVRGLVERGLTPMITLHHFSDPLWLAEMGGWTNEAVVGFFVPFVRKVVDALHDYVKLWVTLNEPNGLVVNTYLAGVFPPGKNDLGAGLKMLANQARAHAAAYKAIHDIQPEARVGLSLYYRGLEPAHHGSPLDKWATKMQANIFNNFFPRAFQSGTLHYPFWSVRLPEVKDTQDFLGLNYYSTDLVAFNLLHAGSLFGRRFYRPGAELSEDGFLANEPEGIFKMLKWGLQFKLPMIITECGVNDFQDTLRPRYLLEHLHQVWRAVNFNFPVQGFFHWTLVDNFEWERGWSQRFGLWELDPATQKRTKRSSANLYTEICRENGISSDMVRKYAPQIARKMFPD